MKKALLIVLAIILTFSSCINAFAEGNKEIAQEKTIKAPNFATGKTIQIPVGDAEYVDIGNGEIIRIADLPSFSTKEAATAYKAKFEQQLAQPRQIEKDVSLLPKQMAKATRAGTNGVQCVASSGTVPCWVSLYVSYSTSGPNHTGEITSHNPYTTFAGWTLGISWHQTHITSRIVGGKDIFAECAGELVYYILIESLLEINRIEIRLSGTCYAVK